MKRNVGRVSQDLGPRRSGMMDQPLGFMPPLFPDEWFYRPAMGVRRDGSMNEVPEVREATHRVATRFYGPRTPLTEVVE